jgi:hypothetical protein
VFPLRHELGFYTPEDDILHSHRRKNLKSYKGFYIPEDGILNGHRREYLTSYVISRMSVALCHLFFYYRTVSVANREI